MATHTLTFTAGAHRDEGVVNTQTVGHLSLTVSECRFVLGAFSTRAAANALLLGSTTDASGNPLCEHYGTCAKGSSIESLFAQRGLYKHIARADIITIGTPTQIVLTDETANIGNPIGTPLSLINILRSMITVRYPFVSDSAILTTRRFDLSLSA